MMIKEVGNLTSLKKAPLYPEGFDPKVVKVWVPKYDEFVKLQKPWLDEWNKTMGIGSDLVSRARESEDPVANAGSTLPRGRAP